MRVRLDGGLATALQQLHGLAPFTSPAPWVMTRPAAISDAHGAFRAAGADMVLSATFRAHRGALPADLDPVLLNRRAVELARACGAHVAGCLGPVSGPGEPWASVDPGRARAAWQEQARALAEADVLVVETLTDPAEAVAAVRALRPVCARLLVATIAPRGDGRLYGGEDAGELARALVDEGADVVGANCGDGPEGVAVALRVMRAAVGVPLWGKPGAGWPAVRDDDTLAEALRALRREGVEWVGGCCGVGPAVIGAT